MGHQPPPMPRVKNPGLRPSALLESLGSPVRALVQSTVADISADVLKAHWYRREAEREVAALLCGKPYTYRPYDASEAFATYTAGKE